MGMSEEVEALMAENAKLHYLLRRHALTYDEANQPTGCLQCGARWGQEPETHHGVCIVATSKR